MPSNHTPSATKFTPNFQRESRAELHAKLYNLFDVVGANKIVKP
jgi:hypothetical protein